MDKEKVLEVLSEQIKDIEETRELRPEQANKIIESLGGNMVFGEKDSERTAAFYIEMLVVRELLKE